MDEGSSSSIRERLTDAVTRQRVPVPPLPSPTVAVVFHHNDLRTHDHYALKLAQQRAVEGVSPSSSASLPGDSPLPLVAVLCLDVRLFAQPSLIGGFYRQSPQRAQFLLSTVEALRKSLTELGIPLVIRTGFPEEEVPRLLQELQCVAAYMTTQYAPHEKKSHDRILQQSGQLTWRRRAATSNGSLRKEGRKQTRSDVQAAARGEEEDSHQQQQKQQGVCQIDSVWQSTLIHLEDLITPVGAMKEGMRWYHDDVAIAPVRLTKPFDVAPLWSASQREVLAMFKDIPEGYVLPYQGAIPTLEDLGYNWSAQQANQFTEVIATESSHPGGEEAAFERLEDWLKQDGLSSMLRLGRVKRSPYKMYSHKQSRVSPYVAVGALSPRKLYERVREHCIDHASDGMSQRRFAEFLLRLSRRDYWHWMGLKYGARLFDEYGPRPEHTDEIPDWVRHPKVVQRWCNALTGIPFVDASMRELVGTGFVSEPGRQAMTWLLTRGYGQDWRLAAEWLERCSLDYDPFVCYGSCAYQSEILKDDFGDPVFNTLYIGHKHDQTGIYIKKWLPQLSKVPSVYIHRPHVLTEKMQKLHNVHLGKTYPFPIKLWDGADTQLGPSELTSYFATEAQWQKSPGLHEALRFDGGSPSEHLARDAGPADKSNTTLREATRTVLPAGERSLSLPATAFEEMEGDYVEVVRGCSNHQQLQQDTPSGQQARRLVVPSRGSGNGTSEVEPLTLSY